MSFLASIPEKISDRLNPIVVKELRQAVQSRFVSLSLVGFLAIQVIVITIFVLGSDVSSEFNSGSKIFVVLQGILIGSCVLFVPIYTSARLGAERANVDLMFITTIKPRSIVTGKLMAAMILTLLLFSACMPFMTFTYLLRGIDLPSMFITLTLGFLLVLAATQSTILMATLPASALARVLLGLAVAVGLIYAAFGGAYGLGYLASSGIGSKMQDWEFLGSMALTLLLTAESVGLMMFLSIALLSPPSSNRMMPVRIFITIAWLVTGVIAWIFSDLVLSSVVPMLSWTIIHVSLLCFALIVATCERDKWGPRVLRKVPRNPLLRLPAFLFFTGGAGGVAWSVILLILTFGASLWARDKLPSSFIFSTIYDELGIMLGFVLYAYAYGITAVMVRKIIFRNRIKTSSTWVIALALLALAAIIPVVFALIASPGGIDHFDDDDIWLIGVPFMLLESQYEEKCFAFASVWAALMLIPGTVWLIDRFLAFKPHRTIPPPLPTK